MICKRGDFLRYTTDKNTILEVVEVDDPAYRVLVKGRGKWWIGIGRLETVSPLEVLAAQA